MARTSETALRRNTRKIISENPQAIVGQWVCILASGPSYRVKAINTIDNGTYKYNIVELENYKGTVSMFNTATGKAEVFQHSCHLYEVNYFAGDLINHYQDRILNISKNIAASD